MTLCKCPRAGSIRMPNGIRYCSAGSRTAGRVPAGDRLAEQSGAAGTEALERPDPGVPTHFVIWSDRLSARSHGATVRVSRRADRHVESTTATAAQGLVGGHHHSETTTYCCSTWSMARPGYPWRYLDRHSRHALGNASEQGRRCKQNWSLGVRSPTCQVNWALQTCPRLLFQPRQR